MDWGWGGGGGLVVIFNTKKIIYSRRQFEMFAMCVCVCVAGAITEKIRIAISCESSA